MCKEGDVIVLSKMIVHLKINYLLNFMLFQTCRTFILLGHTDKKIF